MWAKCVSGHAFVIIFGFRWDQRFIDKLSNHERSNKGCLVRH